MKGETKIDISDADRPLSNGMGHAVRATSEISHEPLADSSPANRGQGSASAHNSHDARRTPRENWQVARKGVQYRIAMSDAFKTLRDMTGGGHIESWQLEKIKEVGSGAFATVAICKYKATQEAEPVLVAVKFLRETMLKDRHELSLFVKEAALMRKLKHRYIVQYIGLGSTGEGEHDEDDGLMAVLHSAFIVQEYINGGTLKKMVLEQMYKNGTVYNNASALAWMRHLAEGLRYLHNSKPQVVHRDLKLENVLLRTLPNGRKEACLADFGLSALLQRDEETPDEKTEYMMASKGAHIENKELEELQHKVEATLQTSDKTVRGGKMYRQMSEKKPKLKTFDLTGKTGSYLYMYGPEVLHGEMYNQRVDQFSLAVIMYEVFSGITTSAIVVGPTFNPKAAEIYAYKIAGGYRRPLPDYWPEALRSLISDCWAQDPAARPSMDDVCARLKAIQDSGVFDAKDRPGWNKNLIKRRGEAAAADVAADPISSIRESDSPTGCTCTIS